LPSKLSGGHTPSLNFDEPKLRREPSSLHIGNAVTSGGSAREIYVRRARSVSSYSRIADQENWAVSSQWEPLVSGHFHGTVSGLRSEGRASLGKHYGGRPGTRHWAVLDPLQRLGGILRLWRYLHDPRCTLGSQTVQGTLSYPPPGIPPQYRAATSQVQLTPPLPPTNYISSRPKNHGREGR